MIEVNTKQGYQDAGKETGFEKQGGGAKLYPKKGKEAGHGHFHKEITQGDFAAAKAAFSEGKEIAQNRNERGPCEAVFAVYALGTACPRQPCGETVDDHVEKAPHDGTKNNDKWGL